MRAIVGILIFLFANKSAANNLWDKVRFENLTAGQTYEISSGTGFFVNPNYIITNNHVVESCKNIAARGAITPTKVTLIANDSNLDLALLYSSTSPKRIANLRINDDQISQGDILFSVGYPLDRDKTGEYLIKEAQVIRVTPLSSQRHTTIEFTNSVDHGNSGGPLLDKNSNVVGIVKAKKTYFSLDDPSKIYKITGIAIGLDGVRSFLQKHGIVYSNNTSYDLFTNYHLDKITEDYVVNIHCVR